MEYERPLILEIEDVAEGIYAYSGTPAQNDECWTVSVTKDQEDAGGYATFRVRGIHAGALHISSKTSICLVFNSPVLNVKFEGFDVVGISGNTVIIERQSLANAYYSTDEFNSLLKVYVQDAADLKTLTCVSAVVTCEKKPNVQGGY